MIGMNINDNRIINQEYPLEHWLKEFKKELKDIFHKDFNSKDEWLDCASTQGWANAMLKVAEKSDYNLGYSIILLYKNLSWNESDDFDSWLIDMAVYYNLSSEE